MALRAFKCHGRDAPERIASAVLGDDPGAVQLRSGGVQVIGGEHDPWPIRCRGRYRPFAGVFLVEDDRKRTYLLQHEGLGQIVPRADRNTERFSHERL